MSLQDKRSEEGWRWLARAESDSVKGVRLHYSYGLSMDLTTEGDLLMVLKFAYVLVCINGP